MPHPCSVLASMRVVQLQQSRTLAASRIRVSHRTVVEMMKLELRSFLKGTESDQAFPEDGEGPVRRLQLDASTFAFTTSEKVGDDSGRPTPA